MNNNQRRLAAIMFTDIVGYSTMINVNEAQSLDLLREHNELLRAVFHSYNSREIKTIGDAFLIEFASAVDAVSCAIEIQRRIAERNRREIESRLLFIRIGIHLGDIVSQENDVFGDGVNIASRIEELAAPGGICISRQVFDQVHNKIQEELVSAGRYKLKNINDPVEIYCIKLPWNDAAISVAAPSGAALDKSVVVLPFTDMSKEQDQEYFCDGITEDIIGALSRVKGIKTVARSSAFAFKNKGMDIREICKSLNVENVVEGSVRKAGNMVRVNSQLIKASDGCYIWSDRFDRNMTDIFAIQDEISFAVVSNLKVKLLGETKSRITRLRTENINAYMAYLKGRYLLNRRHKGDMKKSLQFFHQAIELDPDYAQPYAGIADTYTLLGTYGFLPPSATYSKAIDFADKALKRDDELGDAYTSIAWITATYDYDRCKALSLFEKARNLNTTSPFAHSWYALYLLGLARFDEAAREMKQALELDPLSMIINANLALIYSFSGDQETAIIHYRKALDIDEYFPLTHIWLGMAYLGKREADNALKSFNKSISIEGDRPLTLGCLALVHAFNDTVSEIEEISHRLNKLTADSILPYSYCTALIHIAAGDYDQAFAFLNQACKERDPLLIYLHSLPTLMPTLNSFSSDPRFYEVLKKMDLRD